MQLRTLFLKSGLKLIAWNLTDGKYEEIYLIGLKVDYFFNLD